MANAATQFVIRREPFDSGGRLLVVGKGLPDDTSARLRTTFSTITGALAAIGKELPAPDFWNRYTILVLPGTYVEQVICKDFVSIVGVDRSTCFVQMPRILPERFDEPGFPRDVPSFGQPEKPIGAVFKLANDVRIGELSVFLTDTSRPTDYAFYGRDVRDVGLTNVNVYLASRQPDDSRVAASGTFARGKALRLFGNWHTVISEGFGASYYGGSGFMVELIGNERSPQNADCHFMNAFLDALWVGFDHRDPHRVPRFEKSNGGCILVKDCHEVHFRGSLVRTTDGGVGARVMATRSRAARTRPDGAPIPPVNLLLEGTTVTSGGLALHVGSQTDCVFRNSSVDSICIAADAGFYRDTPPALLEQIGRQCDATPSAPFFPLPLPSTLGALL